LQKKGLLNYNDFNKKDKGEYGMLTKSGQELAEVIKKAIDDHVVTNAEYEEIYNLALQDGILDSHEKVLLSEFKNMIADKSIKRVP